MTITSITTLEGCTVLYARCTTDGMSSITVKNRGICYSTTEELPTKENSNVSTGYWDDTYMYSDIYYIDGLTSSTKYYVRIFIQDSSNNIYYSPAKKVYTTPFTGGIACSTYPSDTSSWTYSALVKTVVDRSLEYMNAAGNLPYCTFVARYNNATTTASFGSGYMNFNGVRYINTGTTLHELGHFMDADFAGALCNQDSEYSQYGHILGTRLAEMCAFWFNNEGACTLCNSIHCFPFTEYDTSYTTELNNFQVLLHRVAAMFNIIKGYDGLVGVSDRKITTSYYSIDEDNIYYIKGLNSGCYITDSGTQMTHKLSIPGDEGKWALLYIPQNGMYYIKNVGTNRYISFSASSGTNDASYMCQISPTIYKTEDGEKTYAILSVSKQSTDYSKEYSSYLNTRRCLQDTVDVNTSTRFVYNTSFNPRLKNCNFEFIPITN